MEKEYFHTLIFDKKKFWETEFAWHLKATVMALEDQREIMEGHSNLSEEYAKAELMSRELLEKLQIYELAMSTFFRMELHFTRTDDYYGLCIENEGFFLIQEIRE